MPAIVQLTTRRLGQFSRWRFNFDFSHNNRGNQLDPQANWESMIAAIVDNDLEAAADLASCLMEWLNRGGFFPTAVPQFGHVENDRTKAVYLINRSIVLHVCAAVRT